ncbi:YkvA family protein [Leptolyngbya sp. AN02str]
MSHPKYRWVVLIAALAYLISPIDISPDVVPIVGWIDDGVLITLVAAGLSQVLLERRQAIKEAKLAQTQANTALTDRTVNVDAIEVDDRTV